MVIVEKCFWEMPPLLFIVIEVGIYSLLQLKLRQKLMDVDFRALV